MNRKFILIITSVICLLPLILSLVIYRDLPDKVAMQWNLEGNPTWYAPKAVAAFGMPVIFAVLNIIILVIIFNDPKHKNISKKLLAIVYLLVPLVSLMTVPLILFSSIGIALPVNIIAFSFAGLILIFIGNYLPKCRQNYTVGLKIPWTLNDSENWNKTHRLAGFIFTITGIIFIIIGFFPLENPLWLVPIFLLITLLVAVPVSYSYCLYKRKYEENNTNNE